jgi:hypothetical protein
MLMKYLTTDELFSRLSELMVEFCETLKKSKKYFWNDLSVYAFDGSKFNLPATPEIRSFFDAKSGLENKGSCQYGL